MYEEIEIDDSRHSVTDSGEVQRLANMAPLAHRAAQDVLVAAEKVIHKKGFWSTEQSRITNLVKALYKVHFALDEDGFPVAAEHNIGRARMFAFFNRFARAYPNWQAEYALLNRVIPNMYEEEAVTPAPPPRQSVDNASRGCHSADAATNTEETDAKAIILCPNCQSRMRVPIGMRIRIRCRDCGNQFIQEINQA